MELRSKNKSDPENESGTKKFLSMISSKTGKIACGFLTIIAGIWIPAILFNLTSWTPIPSIISGIFTVAFGCFITVRGCIELEWDRYVLGKK